MKILIITLLLTVGLFAQGHQFRVAGQFVTLGMTKNAFLNLYNKNSILTISGEETNSIIISDKQTTEIYASCDFENDKLVVVNKYWEHHYDKSTIDFSFALFDILTEIVGSDPIAIVSTSNYSQPEHHIKHIELQFNNSDRSVDIFIDEKNGDVNISVCYRKMQHYK